MENLKPYIEDFKECILKGFRCYVKKYQDDPVIQSRTKASAIRDYIIHEIEKKFGFGNIPCAKIVEVRQMFILQLQDNIIRFKKFQKGTKFFSNHHTRQTIEYCRQRNLGQQVFEWGEVEEVENKNNMKNIHIGWELDETFTSITSIDITQPSDINRNLWEENIYTSADDLHVAHEIILPNANDTLEAKPTRRVKAKGGNKIKENQAK